MRTTEVELRSKLGAALGRFTNIWIKPGSRVLYAGNVCALTVLNLSDLVGSDGLVYVVGFSGGDDVVHMVGKRENVVTIEEKYPYCHWHYCLLVGMVDVIFGEIDHCPNHPPGQQLVDAERFSSDAEALFELNAISTSTLTHKLKHFLERNLPHPRKNYKLATSDSHLGLAIARNLLVPGTSGVVIYDACVVCGTKFTHSSTWICTRNLAPSEARCGEKLVRVQNEDRTEVELRSKLGAALGRFTNIWIKPGSRVLYAGNVCALTVLNLSDLVGSDGLVYVVGFSGGDDVVHMAGKRENVVTIEEKYPYCHWHYRLLVGMVDVVFGEIDHCPNHPPGQQLVDAERFSSDAEALFELNAISTSTLTHKLKHFLERNLPHPRKNYKLATSDSHLGLAIARNLLVPGTSGVVIYDVMRGLRDKIHTFLHLDLGALEKARLTLARLYNNQGTTSPALGSSSSYPHRCTRNLAPSEARCGEKLVRVQNEDRTEVELRSKLGAALGRFTNIWIKPGSRVLYAGNVCALTVLNLSDLVGSDGLVYVVGFSGGDDVVHMAGKRENVVTIEEKYPYCHWHYRLLVGMVDVVFGEIDHCPNHPPGQQVNNNSIGRANDPFTEYNRRNEFTPIETVMLDGGYSVSVGGHRF
ncbi:uncharacterized protein LOC141659506 isoform X3 [Apium graveolens]|uniref:uncharacterized protein LOC141659506 isoform X3 n=1 Tax=Apium graveolens TaxID=4045 RepID=UPI003D7A6FEB